jgi:uncharacterized membrane protein YvlD (DUF360 family)
MKLILKILLTAIAVMVIANFLPGVEVENYYSAIFVAIVLGILRVTIKPLLIFFTLPASTAIYVLSAQLNSDTELASAAILVSTVLSFISLSVVLVM